MEDVRSYYALLRIAPGASQEEIEEAYQRLVAFLGKKITAGAPPPPEEFARLDQAFSTLRDPAQRAAYDQQLQGSTAASDVPPATPFTFAAPAAPNSPRNLPFTFHGNGGEYFRIWIVNLLLSIITLGIYSAWAKVRREQYFHRNLVLDGAGFDYHGNPMVILKGRMIVALIFGAISISQHISIALYFAVLLLGVIVFPWLIMRSMRFRAVNSSYRGLRFAFVGTYGGAFKAFIGYGLLAIFTAGICTPLWIRETRKYALDNLRYGHGEFSCDMRASSIFILLLKIFLVLFVAGIVTAVFFALHKALGFVAILFVMLVYLGIVPYVQMNIENHVWNRTKLDDNNFSSFMEFKRYFSIVLLNWLLILLTLGLYWPWAKVKLVSYRASCTGLTMQDNLDHFMAVASQNTNALGDAAVDMFDFDIAI
jgi:uncharacterized membrane protein YjgN (DUF898 family)